MRWRPLAAAGSVAALVLAVVLGVVLVVGLGPAAAHWLSARPKSPAASVITAPSPSPTPSPSPSPSPSPRPSLGPSPPPPSPVGSPQMFVYIFGSDYGDTAASTLPGAACTASVTMPDGKRTELGALTANQQGTVAWSYPPRSPAPQGMGYHTITCRLGSQSATGSMSFEVGG